MINFNRYPHVNDLLAHYIQTMDREDIKLLISKGIKTSEEAELFSKFIWDMAGMINEDEENGVAVLGSLDNTETLPDIGYEVTKYMKDTGFYLVWLNVSNTEFVI